MNIAFRQTSQAASMSQISLTDIHRRHCIVKLRMKMHAIAAAESQMLLTDQATTAIASGWNSCFGGWNWQRSC